VQYVQLDLQDFLISLRRPFSTERELRRPVNGKPARRVQGRTSYTIFVRSTSDRFSFRRIAIKLCTIAPLSISYVPRVFAKDTTEQYTEPISATVVDIIRRWYARSVVDGGKNDAKLQDESFAT
jgi:hypothetical protein